MKFSLKKIDSFFSVKAKTLILVSFLIIALSLIFIFLRYEDEKRFLLEKQNFYIGKVQNIYNESKKAIDIFFINRAYANLNSYGIEKALQQKDTASLERLSFPRWNVLKKEHPFLQSMVFYDEKFELLAILGENTISNKKRYKIFHKDIVHGFYDENESLIYKIIVPSLNETSEVTGFLVFNIAPTYFLSEIKKLIGFSGYIINANKTKENKVAYSESYEDTLLSIFLANQDKTLERIIDNGKYFKIYKMSENILESRMRFDIVFFQDITHEQLQLRKAIFQSFLIASFLWTIIVIVLNYGFNILIKRLEESNVQLLNKEQKLEQLNENLEHKVAQEIEIRMKKEHEIHEKERMLIHQSKLANIGEMISNIAHQWRQPLTELSAILVAIELFYERGKLSGEKLAQKIEAGQHQIKFMSHTIDDFRNFFSRGKEKKCYRLQEPAQEALNIIRSSLIGNHIDIALHVEHEIVVDGYANEIAQAILNILSNAKDVLKERAILKPAIWISIKQRDQKGIIEIEDNGGGIYSDPIDKIFEPYFSTKHAKSGTGIGLYMCKTIIEKNNQGELNVENTNRGALFQISLDIIS